jgi:hypothetical protein
LEKKFVGVLAGQVPAESCQNGSELPGSIKGGKFLGLLSDTRLFYGVESKFEGYKH